MIKQSFSVYFLPPLIISFSTLSENLVAQTTTTDSIVIDIENFYKVDEGVYRSSQPSAEQFKDLEKKGVKEVLNIRRFNSDDNEAEGTSLKLHWIKRRASQLKEEDLLNAMKIIRDREGDILIHCHHGSDRTGAIVATYRIIFQGWTKEKAIDEMKNSDYGFHNVFRNIPELIESINVEKFKKKLAKL